MFSATETLWLLGCMLALRTSTPRPCASSHWFDQRRLLSELDHWLDAAERARPLWNAGALPVSQAVFKLFTTCICLVLYFVCPTCHWHVYACQMLQVQICYLMTLSAIFLSHRTSTVFKMMIHPLLNTALRGIIWYQGKVITLLV